MTPLDLAERRPLRIVVSLYDGSDIRSPWLTPEAAERQLSTIKGALAAFEAQRGSAASANTPIDLPWLRIQAFHVRSAHLEQQTTEAPAAAQQAV